MIIMVDLEGTLSDHTARLARLRAAIADNPRDREAWKAYYKGLPDDEPRHEVMAFVKDHIRRGERPLIYSTRFINKYNHEEEWLRGHELWEHVDLVQRLPTQSRIPGPSLVADWAKQFKPEILIDDRDEVRDAVRGLVQGMTFLMPKDFVTGRNL